MSEGVGNLHVASRIYLGIHHPIQYNNKVKDIGYVPRDVVPILIGIWKAEIDTDQAPEVTEHAEIPDEAEEDTHAEDDVNDNEDKAEDVDDSEDEEDNVEDSEDEGEPTPDQDVASHQPKDTRYHDRGFHHVTRPDEFSKMHLGDSLLLT